MLRAILFDFNGVLVDDEPIHLALFQKVLREEEITLTREDYYARYLGFDDRGCFRAVLEATGESPTPDRLTRLIVRKSSYYQAHIRQHGFPTYPGAVELITEAAESDLMLGVVSGALRDEVEGALHQWGVRDYFKTLVTAEDVEEGKPDPAGYRRGLENLNAFPPFPSRLIHPHEVLAIEDSPAGLSAAAACALTTLGVAQTYPTSELQAADKVVESIAGLTLGELHKLFAGN